MKFILTFLVLVLFAVTPALAAPSANMSLTKDKHYVNLVFRSLKGIARVDYTLTYDTISNQKGFEGSIKLKSKSSTSASRRQILGTCSSGHCTYHQGVKNVQLEATFTLRSGGTVNVAKSI